MNLLIDELRLFGALTVIYCYSSFPLPSSYSYAPLVGLGLMVSRMSELVVWKPFLSIRLSKKGVV